MGAPLEDIKRLTTYWRDSFDWRKVEMDLNENLPQYMTAVSVEGFEEDIDVHFVYQSSRRVEKGKGIPLLFLHGCMAFFLSCEISKICELLLIVMRRAR